MVRGGIHGQRFAFFDPAATRALVFAGLSLLMLLSAAFSL